MTVRPYRLPLDHEGPKSGRLIDRARHLPFTFDGRPHVGFAGDTLASALLANGVLVVARSFKFHRPRSFLTAGAGEPNGSVAIGAGAGMTPNERATMVELSEGLIARSQNRWPSLAFDAGQLASVFAPLLPAGFQHKAFMRPALAWPLFERAIRQAAGNGPAPRTSDPDLYEHINVACDVLVAGAGVAGIAAARAAAEAGARVIIADHAPRLGGDSDLFDGEIDGAPALDWISANVAALAASEAAHLLVSTTVAGIYDGNFAVLHQRPGAPGPDSVHGGPAPRERLWKVHAREIVVATGALERGLTFADNDRPGVMLGSAVRAYARRYAVVLGRTGIVFTNNDDGYRTALDLDDFGVGVTRVIDVRAAPGGPLAEAARARGIEISPGHAVTAVETTLAGREIRAVRVAALGQSGRIRAVERIACDFLAMSGGWDPQAHLTAHCGGRLAWDDAIQSMKPATMGAHIQAAGAANGTFTLAGSIGEGYAAGGRAASGARGEAASPAGRPRAKVSERREEPLEPLWFVPAPGALGDGARHFIDQASDVTAADIRLAVREGYAGVEHLKRYTALGMGADQGKTGNVSALGFHAEVAGVPVASLGTTTFRPPYLPVSFGAIAGMQAKDLFRPVRLSPVWHWHANNGATFEPVGLWRRPYAYGAGRMAREVAVAGEVRAVRTGVGILDASTLGKIELSGPDAAIFADRIYCGAMAALGIGRCRYGLMLNDEGYVIDDGVVARLAGDRFLLHTTTGGAERIADWLEFWLQTEWPDLQVFVTPVSEQWAQFVVAGPLARDVLEALPGDIDLSRTALPHLGVSQGTLAGVQVRVFRISYTGELSFEVAAPANLADALWEAILAAGKPHAIAPFGTEALHVMRAEKGHIAIGEETDGTVTPFDLGLAHLVAADKQDFIGKLGLARSDLQRPDRHQLVGLLTPGRRDQLPQGAYLIDADQRDATLPHRIIGHVTSSHPSPTLGRPIALALVAGGRARLGETVLAPVGRDMVEAEIAAPACFDPAGARHND